MVWQCETCMHNVPVYCSLTCKQNDMIAHKKKYCCVVPTRKIYVFIVEYVSATWDEAKRVLRTMKERMLSDHIHPHQFLWTTKKCGLPTSKNWRDSCSLVASSIPQYGSLAFEECLEFLKAGLHPEVLLHQQDCIFKFFFPGPDSHTNFSKILRWCSSHSKAIAIIFLQSCVLSYLSASVQSATSPRIR